MEPSYNILETSRLIIRTLTALDKENFYLLNLDPDVIRYTGDLPFDSIEHAEKFLLNYDHYKKYGFGRWAVINKYDNNFLGWCGLKYSTETNEYDIGFRFFKKEWNKGYATESAKACIDIGFNTYNMNTIIGRVMCDNTASIKVLEKSGLKFYKSCEFAGKEGMIYKIDKLK